MEKKKDGITNSSVKQSENTEKIGRIIWTYKVGKNGHIIRVPEWIEDDSKPHSEVKTPHRQ